MKRPSSVPPAPDLREWSARFAGGPCAGAGEIWVIDRDVGSRSWAHIASGALDAEHGEPVAQHLARRRDERQARALRSRIVDQESLGIIVTVEFGGQFLR